MPRRHRTDKQVLKDKLGDAGYSGGLKYMPPSGGRYLVKNGDEEKDEEALEESLLRRLITEIIRKCGDEWCLYTKSKDPKTGKRRRLGTHSSKSGAERQERAIKSHGG